MQLPGEYSNVDNHKAAPSKVGLPELNLVTTMKHIHKEAGTNCAGGCTRSGRGKQAYMR